MDDMGLCIAPHAKDMGEGSTSTLAARTEILLPSNPEEPGPILADEAVFAAWPRSPGFRAFWGWIQRRCERLNGKEIVRGDYGQSPKAIQVWMKLLDGMTEWVKEVPLAPQANQRFGNLAFRQYIALVEARIPAYFEETSIPEQLPSQLLPLLLNSNAFGHATRLDYGTGHELAFMLGLWCCVVSGWVGGEGKEEEEDEMILRVFARYLDLATLLQSTYKLEPAGSHGVWGLDDYCFLPYLFGSAQLLDSDTSPKQALETALSKRTNPDTISDFFTLSLHRITMFKKGAAFSEHSPMLHSLSQMPNWNKPHSGLRKMFLGEVVGKRVVVQGVWIGGWCWGPDLPKVQVRSMPTAEAGQVVTKAPWAR